MSDIPDVTTIINLDKAKEARASGGNRNYARPGEFLSIIENSTFGKKQEGETPYFAMAFRHQWAAPNSQMAVNELQDYFADLSKSWGYGNLMMVIQAVLRIPEADVKAMNKSDFATTLNGLFGMQQLSSGVWVKVRNVAGVTRKGARAGEPNCVAHISAPTEKDFKDVGLPFPYAGEATT